MKLLEGMALMTNLFSFPHWVGLSVHINMTILLLNVCLYALCLFHLIGFPFA